MQYQQMCGERVSALGMGNMRLPTVGEKGEIDRDKARAIIEQAYHSGVNYFDTAYRYHGGESERFVGEVLRQYPRESFFLASKLPGHMMNYKNGKLGFQGYLSDFHCDHISDIFEEQLQKCGVDYFNFYLLHNVTESSLDFYLNPEVGAVSYLLEQKAKGRIRHLGFSAHGTAQTIDRFLSAYPAGTFEFVQLQLNYLDWKLQDAKGKYETVTRHGLPIVVMEPVRGGRLVQLQEKNQAMLRAARPEDSNAAWAFNFLRALPNVAVILSGMTTMEQLQENVETFSSGRIITEEERAILEKIVDSMLHVIPCTGCRYCTEECPAGLEIPKLVAIYNDMINGGTTVHFNLSRENPAEDPSRCVGCGVCTGVCPQAIAVPEIMKKLSEKMIF